MSREIAGAGNSAPLTSELFHASVYKPSQGRIVRQLTALTIWIIVTLGCWAMYSSLRGGMEAGSYLIPGIPAAVLLAGLWFGYRVVNWPRFADFLIAVEAEMNKVTWPSKDELIRASVVVMFTIFFLATSLFLFDVVWQQFFNFIGVTS
ncbi:MAG: preprotein translocase subunit SecE [Rubripirellula sp.]